ncbi:MAG: alpha/beta hydrolase [Acidimicrobiaceae bacterium]|nr:alpha/beta hydrolase [Acidimicrobiaceae bacterium]
METFSECFEPSTGDQAGEGAGDAGSALPVLLVSGADSHCTRWTPTLVEPLVARGHRVVRYDHRDSGLSTKVPADQPYTLDDLVDDALVVLETHGVERAHVVGRSMGGMVGQLLALDHAERVATLTLVASTPGLGDERLPPAEDDLLEWMTERLFTGPPTDPADRVAWIVELDEMFAGSRHPEPTEHRIRVAVAEVERGWYPESGHGSAVVSSPSRLDRLASLGVPTLVVHGTTDPVFPVEHGLALADGIPGADLWLVEELGHELPDGMIPDLLDRLYRLFTLA